MSEASELREKIIKDEFVHRNKVYDNQKEFIDMRIVAVWASSWGLRFA